RPGRAARTRSPSSADPRRSPQAPRRRGSAIEATRRRGAARPPRSASSRLSPNRRARRRDGLDHYPASRPVQLSRGHLPDSLTARTAILGRVARSSALALTLAADAERRPRARLEPFGRDLVAAIRARPVRPVVDALQRAVDLREDVLGVLLERVVELAVVRHGRGVREVVVVDRVLAGFVAERARVLLVQVVDRRLHTLTLLSQEVAETVG